MALHRRRLRVRVRGGVVSGSKARVEVELQQLRAQVDSGYAEAYARGRRDEARRVRDELGAWLDEQAARTGDDEETT